MNTRPSGIVAMLALCAAALLAAQSAQAQAVFNNPPCAFITVTNLNPACNAQINFITVPAGALPGFFLAAGGGTVNLPVPAGGVQVVGLSMPWIPAAIRFQPPPAPFAACGPAGWWAVGVPLDPLNPACLFNVCADPTTCSITVF